MIELIIFVIGCALIITLMQRLAFPPISIGCEDEELHNKWNCDICHKSGSFSSSNFIKDGLYGFIGFTRDDFNELGLEHLTTDSIRCEQCLLKLWMGDEPPSPPVVPSQSRAVDDRIYVSEVGRVVTATAGQNSGVSPTHHLYDTEKGCRCKQEIKTKDVEGQYLSRSKGKMTDYYTSTMEYVPHSHWQVWSQKHDKWGWQFFLVCSHCKYEFAREYWYDEVNVFHDYTTSQGYLNEKAWNEKKHDFATEYMSAKNHLFNTHYGDEELDFLTAHMIVDEFVAKFGLESFYGLQGWMQWCDTEKYDDVVRWGGVFHDLHGRRENALLPKTDSYIRFYRGDHLEPDLVHIVECSPSEWGGELRFIDEPHYTKYMRLIK